MIVPIPTVVGVAMVVPVSTIILDPMIVAVIVVVGPGDLAMIDLHWLAIFRPAGIGIAVLDVRSRGTAVPARFRPAVRTGDRRHGGGQTKGNNR
ncbi:MAG TPA: hypothetical protein VG269_05140 [Tepidisphaeraceae bacterium]|nr:hypothetical protein [Tepidisphaeraceae bacterium]